MERCCDGDAVPFLGAEGDIAHPEGNGAFALGGGLCVFSDSEEIIKHNVDEACDGGLFGVAAWGGLVSLEQVLGE